MMEMEQLTERFIDAVAMGGDQDQDQGATAAAEESAAVPRPTEVEELIDRSVDVTVRDGPAPGEAACAVRVRLPDGRVFDMVFGAGRPVAALFRYCSAAAAARGMVRFAGGASDEIPPRGDAPFHDLRLDHCILHVVFSP